MTHHEQPGCTLQQYADAKRLPVPFLKTLGLSDMHYMGTPAVRIPYRDAQGQEEAVRFRIALEGKDRFRWKQGSKLTLYANTSLIASGIDAVLVEGESDCHTLWHHGICAYGLPGATNWKEEYAKWLGQHDVIYVLIEPDTGGEAVLKWLARSQIRHKVKLVRLNDFKDPSAMHCDAPEQFKERWQQVLAAAKPYTEYEREAADGRRGEAWTLCRPLAELPDILTHFIGTLKKQGFVGQEREAKLLYLFVVSRLLPRPVSCKVSGPSSGGKSCLVKSVLKFFPESAFYRLTAMSDRTLAYTEEPIQHRVVIVAEATALTSEIGAYLMRTLLSEDRIDYEFVEKTRNGMHARKIVKEGPCGFITTTTATQLHAENETRLFALSVLDIPEQTKAIFASQAADFMSLAADTRPDTDYTSWHALQHYLEEAERRVVISYADKLAESVPPAAIRLRRDFKLVLSIICAHAILHQASRKRDDIGRIVATLDDYAVVRELIHDLIAAQAEATVSMTVRETVQAVEAIIADKQAESLPAHVSNTEIMAALKLDRSPVSSRVKKAISLGYLSNNEARKGKPAQLVMGNPMPEDTPILPTVETLKALLHCSSIKEGDNIPPSPSMEEEIVL